MAVATGMSQTAISRIWRAFGLKPRLVQTWQLSSDPEFIGKVRDIAGFYLNPPDKALVLAVDEKSQIQAYPGTIRASVAAGKRPLARPACRSRTD